MGSVVCAWAWCAGQLGPQRAFDGSVIMKMMMMLAVMKMKKTEQDEYRIRR